MASAEDLETPPEGVADDPLISQVCPAAGVNIGEGIVVSVQDHEASERVMQMFRTWDEEGTGKINKETLVRMIQSLDGSYGSDELERLFREMDQNSDGIIDFEEFVAWLFSRAEAPDRWRRDSGLEEYLKVNDAESSRMVGVRLSSPSCFLPAPAGAKLTALAVFSGTARPLAALGSESGLVYLVDIDAGRILRSLSPPGGGSGVPVASMRFSSDGSMLACAAAALFIWTVPKGELQAALLHDKRATVADCAWDAVDSKIVVAEGASTKIWELDTSQRNSIKGSMAGVFRTEKLTKVHGCCFMADGGVVTVGSGTGVYVHKAGRRRATTSKPTKLGEHGGHVFGCCISPRGRSLLTLSSDRQPHIWDLVRDCYSHKLLGHNSDVKAGVFRPEAGAVPALIATASMDCTARVWQAGTGRCLATAEPGGEVVGVAFVERGDWPALCTITAAGLQLWSLEAETLRAAP